MGLMPRSLLRLILEGNALSFPTTGQANPARRVIYLVGAALGQ